MSKRIQFEFSQDDYERLSVLKEKTHSITFAAVIRDAMRVYEWLIEEREAGHQVAATDGGKILNVVKLFL